MVKQHLVQQKFGDLITAEHTQSSMLNGFNLIRAVKIYHGIIELRHHIDLRRMELLKERYAE